MRAKHILSTTAVVLALGATSAFATSVAEQSVEVDGSFTFQHTSVDIDNFGDYGVTVFNVNALLGYFFNPQMELLGGLLIDHQSIDDFSTTGLGLKVAGRYHFAVTGNVLPYAGLGLAVVSHGGDGDNDDAEFVFPEIAGGIRFPFKDVASVNVEVGYRHSSNPFGIDDSSGDEFYIGAGFSLFLRGGFTQ